MADSIGWISAIQENTMRLSYHPVSGIARIEITEFEQTWQELRLARQRETSILPPSLDSTPGLATHAAC